MIKHMQQNMTHHGKERKESSVLSYDDSTLQWQLLQNKALENHLQRAGSTPFAIL